MQAHEAAVDRPGEPGGNGTAPDPPTPAIPDAVAPGSFAGTLRLAIQRSGLTLDRLQHHLRQRGHPVSVAALSYWQRGRSRPERAGSLAAVRALEEILALPAGTLIDRLAEQPARARRGAHEPGDGSGDPARLWDDESAAARVLTQVDRSCDHRLARLSLHDVYLVGRDRRPTALRVRQVLQALDDGVDRIAGGYRLESPGESPPELTGMRYCRRGRVRSAGGNIAFELFFDRVLVRGDTTVVEYELTFSGERPTSCFYDRRFRYPVRDYLAVVEFQPEAVPVRCHRYQRADVDAPAVRLGELWVGTSHSAHLSAHDVTSGIVGVEWEWS